MHFTFSPVFDESIVGGHVEKGNLSLIGEYQIDPVGREKVIYCRTRNLEARLKVVEQLVVRIPLVRKKYSAVTRKLIRRS